MLAAAWSLSAEDQVHLAETIWDEIPPEDWPLPTEEWIAEAQRRSAEYDAGRMTAATWTEVQSHARQKAGLDE